MIESARIVRFQPWDEVSLDFSPGVNVIIGKTDSGKSSLIRAIRWPITNKPTGDTIHSHWLGRGEETSSTLTTDDGQVVTRYRSKSSNLYILNGEELAAPGVSVPEQVQKALNFADINIQTQVESFFLLNFSSGEVARYLNKVVDLEEIDNSQLYAGREVRRHRKLLEDSEEKVRVLTDKLEVLKWVAKAETKFKQLEAESRAIARRESELSRLDTLLHRLGQSQNKLDSYSHVPQMRQRLDKCLTQQAAIEVKEEALFRLTYLVRGIEATEDRLQRYVKVPEMREKLDRCFDLAAEVREKELKLSRLITLVEDIEDAAADMRQQRAQLTELEEEFHRLMPDVCPLCGRSG